MLCEWIILGYNLYKSQQELTLDRLSSVRLIHYLIQEVVKIYRSRDANFQQHTQRIPLNKHIDVIIYKHIDVMRGTLNRRDFAFAPSRM